MKLKMILAVAKRLFSIASIDGHLGSDLSSERSRTIAAVVDLFRFNYYALMCSCAY